MRLLEWMGYDAAGQPVTTTFADYLLPTATEVPKFETLYKELPSPHNPLGVKGVGEVGVIPAAAAVISAIEDALSPFGVHIAQMPIMPHELVDLDCAKVRQDRLLTRLDLRSKLRRSDRICQEENYDEQSLKPAASSSALVGVRDCALPCPAHAENFPSRPIHLIIPYGPGGIVDFAGREVAQKLSEVMGQTVVAENQPGAGGIVGVDVRRAFAIPTATTWR